MNSFRESFSDTLRKFLQRFPQRFPMNGFLPGVISRFSWNSFQVFSRNFFRGFPKDFPSGFGIPSNIHIAISSAVCGFYGLQGFFRSASNDSPRGSTRHSYQILSVITSEIPVQISSEVFQGIPHRISSRILTQIIRDIYPGFPGIIFFSWDSSGFQSCFSDSSCFRYYSRDSFSNFLEVFSKNSSRSLLGFLQEHNQGVSKNSPGIPPGIPPQIPAEISPRMHLLFFMLLESSSHTFSFISRFFLGYPRDFTVCLRGPFKRFFSKVFHYFVRFSFSFRQNLSLSIIQGHVWLCHSCVPYNYYKQNNFSCIYNRFHRTAGIVSEI